MNIANATILIVDDEIDNRQQLEEMLRPEGYLTVSAASGKQALVAVADQVPDLILLDVTMPGMDGFEVASLLKANPVTANIPIIMVTAQVGRAARVVGLNSGAEEYLTRPVDSAELSLRVRNLLRLKALGDTAAPEAAAGAGSVSIEPTETTHQVHYDPVTGLASASLFHEAMQKTLADAAQNSSQVAVMSIDLDDFKKVNNTLGIDTGDELLRQFGGHLVRCASSRDAVSRMGEDKFVLVQEIQGGRQSALDLANAIRDALHAPFDLKDNEVMTTASIGIAFFPDHSSDAESLIEFANGARRKAKLSGGDCCHIHTV
ncbi:MAG: diguanylate cyclase [Arenimonas sp.]